jgi:hypothetical protein
LSDRCSYSNATHRVQQTAFRWDGAKFNVNTNLPELAKDVVSKVTEIDREMKKKLTSYNKVKSAFSSIERSNT